MFKIFKKHKNDNIVSKIKDFEEYIKENKIPLTVEILGIDGTPHIANVFKICLIKDITEEWRISLVGDEYVIKNGKLITDISPRVLKFN